MVLCNGTEWNEANENEHEIGLRWTRPSLLCCVRFSKQPSQSLRFVRSLCDCQKVLMSRKSRNAPNAQRMLIVRRNTRWLRTLWLLFCYFDLIECLRICSLVLRCRLSNKLQLKRSQSRCMTSLDSKLERLKHWIKFAEKYKMKFVFNWWLCFQWFRNWLRC